MWWLVNFPHKWPVTRKMFLFDDVIMWNRSPRKEWILSASLKYKHAWLTPPCEWIASGLTVWTVWAVHLRAWFAQNDALIIHTHTHTQTHTHRWSVMGGNLFCIDDDALDFCRYFYIFNSSECAKMPSKRHQIKRHSMSPCSSKTS